MAVIIKIIQLATMAYQIVDAVAMIESPRSLFTLLEDSDAYAAATKVFDTPEFHERATSVLSSKSQVSPRSRGMKICFDVGAATSKLDALRNVADVLRSDIFHYGGRMYRRAHESAVLDAIKKVDEMIDDFQKKITEDPYKTVYPESGVSRAKPFRGPHIYSASTRASRCFDKNADVPPRKNSSVKSNSRWRSLPRPIRSSSADKIPQTSLPPRSPQYANCNPCNLGSSAKARPQTFHQRNHLTRSYPQRNCLRPNQQLLRRRINPSQTRTKKLLP